MNPQPPTWDAAVIGAGVAGGVASAMLAARGWRVLLVEKSPWPREKVCGGCLTANAARVLSELGIPLPGDRTRAIQKVFWHAGGSTLSMPIPGEIGILRSDLDAAIVSEAVRRGCEFLSGATAWVLPASREDEFREISLQTGRESRIVRARVVLACDGIGGTSLGKIAWAKWQIARNSRIGVAGTWHGADRVMKPGEIHMHVGKAGYVGLVSFNENCVHLAAALDPAECRRAGGPGEIIRRILTDERRPIDPHWQFPRLRGTGPLTRRRRQLAGHRLLVAGDACGYVEPFTGEGMAWAAIGAREAVNLLPEPRARWPGDLTKQWKRRHDDLIARKQVWCRAMRPMMRYPRLGPLVIGAVNAMPALGTWLAMRISQPRACEAFSS